MANELTKSVMARIVERIGPEVGYRAMPEPAVAARPENHKATSPIQESTLRKIIHKEMSIGNSNRPFEKKQPSGDTGALAPCAQHVKSLSNGGVVKLDDLLNALKK